MKNLFLILILFISFNIFGQAQLQNKEFRATWVITWEYITGSSSVEENKARIREILDNHQKANMTSVLLQVRQGGAAYYNSSYEPWGSYAGASYPGFDPLEYAIEEAHSRGLELHAWFNVFNVSATLPGTIADKHPEWICRDQDGNPMTSYRAASPGLAAVRDYTTNVAMEIVRNYDIDGLHLDYIRWNEYDTSDMNTIASPLRQESILDGEVAESKLNKITDSKSTTRFLFDVEHPYSAGVPSGYASWEDWWRWSVTEFVKNLHDSIQTVKPWVRLSPAALGKYKDGGSNGWNGYYVVFQDAALWFNEGYVDQLTPMHYHWLTGNELYNAISSDWEPNIQKGIADGRLYSVGPPSYRLADNNLFGNHKGIVEQMRNKQWIDGFQFFSYGSWRGYDYWEEAGSTFFDRKVKIRDIISVGEPSAPSLTLSKINDLSYNLIVTPHSSEVDNQWHIIYRSEDDVLDENSDLILDIHFGNSEYTINEVFPGTQNYNGSYKYFATTLNRYWNESTISNSETTDFITSFAPTISTTIPAENEEIDINKEIIIEFSKSMNMVSFGDHISIVPFVQINSLLWSTDNKTLKINFENLVYNTSYSLVISRLAADVNGVQLDGNGDGVEGDNFVLNFRTSEFDSFPPQIVSTLPNNGDLNIDIGSIISLEFDEKLDEGTLVSNGISLWKQASSVDFSYLHTESIDGRSIISIQPSEMFDISSDYTLTLASSITDSVGNALENDFNLSFTTAPNSYTEIKIIDNFTSPGEWWQPSASGSTSGIFESGTNFGYSTEIIVPASVSKRAAKLSYLWDENATTHLIREYLSGGTPQLTYFDTTYVLQSYVFGDGSNNQVRLCIDENDGSAWGDHEVSQWITIDWQGWKLIEWELSDPNSVGTWISSNEFLTGSYFRVDSYQLTKGEGGNLSGTVYFDDLRAVKKEAIHTDIEYIENETIPTFHLSQNYPNPFNPTTTIKYTIPFVKSNELAIQKVTLKVYDVLGREVATLVNENKQSGNYQINFDGTKLNSGVYFYSLVTGSFRETKRMLLVK